MLTATDVGDVGDNESGVGGGGDVCGDGVQCEENVGGKTSKKGKRVKKGWSKHKIGAKSRGEVDFERREKVKEKVDQIKRAKELLQNPYDEMDIDTKRAHAIFYYNEKMSECLSADEVAFSSKSVSVKKKSFQAGWC